MWKALGFTSILKMISEKLQVKWMRVEVRPGFVSKLCESCLTVKSQGAFFASLAAKGKISLNLKKHSFPWKVTNHFAVHFLSSQPLGDTGFHFLCQIFH